MITSDRTIALTTSDLRAARSQHVPLDTLPQQRKGTLLELQFPDKGTRDVWIAMIETALDNDALGLAPLPPVPAHVTQAAKDLYRDSAYRTPPPVPPSDRTTWVTPTDNPGAVWTGFLWILFWGALLIGGAVTFLGWLAGIVGR